MWAASIRCRVHIRPHFSFIIYIPGLNVCFEQMNISCLTPVAFYLHLLNPLVYFFLFDSYPLMKILLPFISLPLPPSLLCVIVFLLKPLSFIIYLLSVFIPVWLCCFWPLLVGFLSPAFHFTEGFQGTFVSRPSLPPHHCWHVFIGTFHIYRQDSLPCFLQLYFYLNLRLFFKMCFLCCQLWSLIS